MRYFFPLLLLLGVTRLPAQIDVGTDPVRLLFGFYPISVSGPAAPGYLEWTAEYIYALHYRSSFLELNQSSLSPPEPGDYLRRGHKGVAALRVYPFSGGERQGQSVGVFYPYARVHESRGAGTDLRREHTYGFELGRQYRSPGGVFWRGTFGIGLLDVYGGTRAGGDRRRLTEEAGGSMYLTCIIGFGRSN